MSTQADNEAGPPPSKAGFIGRVVANYRAIFLGLLLLLTGLFVLYVIRLDQPPLPPLNVSDVWIESMDRLGISGVYPPREDLYVGDVWAAITKAPNEGKFDSDVVLRATRIGHIDLKDQIEIVCAYAGGTCNGSTPVSDESAHRIVGFPAFTIQHAQADSSAPTLGPISISLSRGKSDYDEMNIPSAFSYGADSAEVAIAIINFCSNSKTAIRCKAEYVRRILSLAVTHDARVESGQKADYGIQLRVISRVYLTKLIEHKRTLGGDVGADVSKTEIGAKASYVYHKASDSTEVSNSIEFEKPLVFGYQFLALQPVGE